MKKYIKKRVTILSNPTRYSFLLKEFKNGRFRLLDIGAGNNSATKTKAVFPDCEYYGLDKTRHYNYSTEDFNLMRDFYETDLSRLNFNKIPDNFFNAIVMSHIIEHLHNGDLVIEKLIPKLKNKGYFYIEYPGLKSTKLPSMRGTLNFYDDPTHVRLYSLNEVGHLLTSNGFKILKSGIRRNWIRILCMPLIVPLRMIKEGHLNGSDFWDLLGFAEFVIAKKNFD